jgi:hypothetical protein
MAHADSEHVELQLVDAIKVVLWTDHIRDYLSEHDPMALKQLEDALEANGIHTKPLSSCPPAEWNYYVEFEYDENWAGGEYFDTGKFVYVPLPLVYEVGPRRAFEKTTGISWIHVVSQNGAQYFDKDGAPVSS